MSTYWRTQIAVAAGVLTIMLITAISRWFVMPMYKGAFIVAAVLLMALAFMQVHMRQQVHHANYSGPEISPRDMRFANSMFGAYGIRRLHKRTYERSTLRSWFLSLLFAWIVCVAVALLDLVVRHR